MDMASIQVRPQIEQVRRSKALPIIKILGSSFRNSKKWPGNLRVTIKGALYYSTLGRLAGANWRPGQRQNPEPFGKPIFQDASGATAIEFALVAPAFLALLLATLYTALAFFAQQGLETAAEGSARLIMTGQAQNFKGTDKNGQSYTGMTAEDFRQAACKAIPPFLSCNRLYADVQTSASYSSANLTAPAFTYDAGGNVTTKFNYSPGTQGAIVVVRLAYLWPTGPGPLGFTLVNQPDSNRLLLASSVLKTEGY